MMKTLHANSCSGCMHLLLGSAMPYRSYDESFAPRWNAKLILGATKTELSAEYFSAAAISWRDAGDA